MGELWNVQQVGSHLGPPVIKGAAHKKNHGRIDEDAGGYPQKCLASEIHEAAAADYKLGRQVPDHGREEIRGGSN